MPKLAAQKFCKSICYSRGKYTNCCTDCQPKAKKFVRHFYESFFQTLIIYWRRNSIYLRIN